MSDTLAIVCVAAPLVVVALGVLGLIILLVACQHLGD